MMKNIHSLSDQQIIESIVIDGKTEQMAVLYDRYYDLVYQYLVNYAEDPVIAKILSYYSMRYILLHLPNYSPSQPFLTYVYANTYKICCDWIEKKENNTLDYEKIASFVPSSKTEVRTRVLNCTSRIFWEILAKYFNEKDFDFKSIQYQVPNNELLAQCFQLEKGETTLILMNVWSTLAIQYATDYKETFRYFDLPNSGKTSFVDSFLNASKPMRRNKGQDFFPVLKNIGKNLKKLGLNTKDRLVVVKKGNAVSNGVALKNQKNSYLN